MKIADKRNNKLNAKLGFPLICGLSHMEQWWFLEDFYTVMKDHGFYYHYLIPVVVAIASSGAGATSTAETQLYDLIQFEPQFQS